ncbi:MAG: L,D-transpeptidase family protein [Gammaproteobacteria bacterium]|nr:L,D-transpeptidase family protein [Gammaproteobacteria bacterium]
MICRLWVLAPLCCLALSASPSLYASDFGIADETFAHAKASATKVVFTTLPDIRSKEELDELGLRSGAVQDPLKAWFDLGRATTNTNQLIAAIQESAFHGLDPEFYGYTELSSRLAAQRKLPIDSPARAQEQRSMSLTLDISFQSLAQHLGSGIAHGPTVQPQLHREPPTVDTEALLNSVKTGGMSVQQALWQVMPTDEAYFRLTDTMRSLLGELEFGLPRTRVQRDGTLELGDNDIDVLNIKDRLSETGDYSRRGRLTRDFDESLVAAVKNFQRRHNLPVTGTVDKEVRQKLNATVEDDITAVALSLERWRWMPRDLGKKHVFVNIPEYRAKLYNEGQKIVDMRVVVGAVKHKTPVFTRDASIIEIAPTWTVPSSITNKELVPKERRNPGYLAKKNFDFYRWTKNGMQHVPSSEVTAEDFQKKKFPYILRQRAGAGNALGKLKILMPNPWAIYMHDTQAKKFFKKRVRAYSHGCVRLSDPDRMASMMMQLDGVSKKKTDFYLNSKDTKRVVLRDPIPTHLTYMTTWVDGEGMLNTSGDIYRYDQKLVRALERNDTVLAAVKRHNEGMSQRRLANAGI